MRTSEAGPQIKDGDGESSQSRKNHQRVCVCVWIEVVSVRFCVSHQSRCRSSQPKRGGAESVPRIPDKSPSGTRFTQTARGPHQQF